ncbi:LacI family DNA-binding transcriptional regulator [Pseudomonas aeruginosa]|nr:LacI family DNA-binding transcriptional regulator [Pseudomonas aeruginosa]
MATMKDVAAMAGVSFTTVSHVVNRTRPVSDAVRKKVEDAIAQLHYVPSAVARSLKVRTTSIIGLLVPNSTNPYFAELSRGIEDCCERNGYCVILCNSDDNPQKQANYLRVLQEKRIDGLVLASAGGDGALAKGLANMRTPTVIVDREVEGVEADRVQIDHEMGAYLATRHLLELGHRDIACIAGALVTGIKSDLPGDVIATVTEPVFDTATGKFLLIPQGSRILGRYNSQVSYGQSRVQVVWNRVILPDTSSLTLDNLVGTDPAGYAGLEDDVDWHWNRIVAGAVLTTLLGVGAELAAPENRQDGNRIVIAGRDSAQDSINQVGQEITRRNMNIQPTLTSRPGLPVRIIVNRDLVLRPYQPLFFNRGASQ